MVQQVPEVEDIGSDLVPECVTFSSIGWAVNKEVVDGFIPQVALLAFGAWGSRDVVEVFVQGGMACAELEDQGGWTGFVGVLLLVPGSVSMRQIGVYFMEAGVAWRDFHVGGCFFPEILVHLLL